MNNSISFDQFRTIYCRECGRSIRAELHIGERGLLPGYHGKCPFCGWQYEPLGNDPSKKKEKIDRTKIVPIGYCQQCPFYILSGTANWCGKLTKRLNIDVEKEIPDWCPLSDAPNKKDK